MHTQRSFHPTFDVASRRSASCEHGCHGRFHVQLALAAIACLTLLSQSLSAATPEGNSAPIVQPAPQDPLLTLVDEAIEKSSKRYLDVRQHTPWQIIHGLLALRKDFVLRDGDRTVNAIDWMSSGAAYKGTPLFEATQFGGRAQPYNGVMYDFEGHVNQTLALMSMSNLPTTHVFTVAGGRKVTMADMIRHAQMTVNTSEETTWTLWFLTHYLDPEKQWSNQWGQKWGMDTLVHVQNQVDVTKAPCGGTHNLFALAYARNSYLRKNGKLRGVWLQADQKIQDHIKLVRSLQNADGSFSSDFFKGPGYSRDFNERIKSSGHNIEWLMMALPQNRLSEEWIRNGIRSLAQDLVNNAAMPADCGPLYHSLDALILYRQRVTPESEFKVDRPLAYRRATPNLGGPVAQRAPDDSTGVQKSPTVRQPERAPVLVQSPVRTNPQPLRPSPSVAAEPESNSLSASSTPAPRPLSLSINGRPIRVAELPGAGVSDSPVRLKPATEPVIDEEKPSETLDAQPTLPAPKSEEPAESPVVPDPEVASSTPVDETKPAQEPMLPADSVTPPEETPGASTEQAPLEQSEPEPNSAPAQKPTTDIEVKKPEPMTSEPDSDAASKADEPLPMPPAETPAVTPKPEQSAVKAPTTSELTQPVAEPGEKIGVIRRAPPQPPANPQPSEDRESRSRFDAPKDVFVPLRRRLLQQRRGG